MTRPEPPAAKEGSFVALAREIEAEVARIAADPDAHPAAVAEYIERLPADARAPLVREIFARLPAPRQWAILESVFGDAELRRALEPVRDAAVAAADARAAQRLDTTVPAEGDVLALGLFREPDVRAAIPRGHVSASCARRVTLRARGDGTFQVIDDVFNPNGGYFVTREYREETWRDERLAPHAVVRAGTITDAPRLDPVLHPGGRVDFEVGGVARPGQLHLGFAMLNDVDIFVG